MYPHFQAQQRILPLKSAEIRHFEIFFTTKNASKIGFSIKSMTYILATSNVLAFSGSTKNFSIGIDQNKEVYSCKKIKIISSPIIS